MNNKLPEIPENTQPIESPAIPLFDPESHALLREPTEEEKAIADSKANMLKILRDPLSTKAACEEATEILRGLWTETGVDPQVQEEILASMPARKELALKDILLIDPLHPESPPEGYQKALLVTELRDRRFMVAVNVKEGEVGVPRYSGDLYGVVLAGPVLLEDHEWKKDPQ